MNKREIGLLAVGVATSLLVAGCGGGGGDGHSSGGTTPSSGVASAASAPVAVSAPIAPPAPASAPSGASQPTVPGEPLPNLTSPQAGSTAASATDPEGIWKSADVTSSSYAFVDAQNHLTWINVVGSFAEAEAFGSMTVSGTSWTLGQASEFNDLTQTVAPVTSGSGTFTAKKTLSGSVVINGSTSNVSWAYDPANALSVTQQSVAGTWTASNASMTIDNAGTFSGTLSGCTVSGTMLLSTPGSNQNMYNISLTAATGTGCKIPAGVPLTGNAAIIFSPITGSNGFSRQLLYVARSSDTSLVAYGGMSKQ